MKYKIKVWVIGFLLNLIDRIKLLIWRIAPPQEVSTYKIKDRAQERVEVDFIIRMIKYNLSIDNSPLLTIKEIDKCLLEFEDSYKGKQEKAREEFKRDSVKWLNHLRVQPLINKVRLTDVSEEKKEEAYDTIQKSVIVANEQGIVLK